MDQGVGVTELRAFLNAHPEMRFIDGIYGDICGFVRGKRYPIEQAEKLWKSGLQMPEAHFILDALGDGSDPLGRGFSDGDPDCMMIAVPGSLVPVPWASEPRAQVLMTQAAPGAREPAFVDPRQLLRRVAERFAQTGFKPVMAFELEFFLHDRDLDPQGRPQAPFIPGTRRRISGLQATSIEELDQFGAFVAEVQEVCKTQKIPSTAANTEFAQAQYEINLDHVEDPALAADHALLQRRVVRAIAERHEMRASFMSKPFLDRAGCGMHIHVSLVDKTGRNVFDDGGERGSDLLRHAIGGCQAALAESMAIFAPHLNAFRRYTANLFVPVNKSWGYDNRSVAFRVPVGNPKARRIEHRVAGADANPYLAAAALLAAIQHGLERRLDPGQPSNLKNVSGQVDPDLPLQLLPALDRLEQATILAQAIDPSYLKLYAAVKRNEYASFMSEIFEREYSWYL